VKKYDAPHPGKVLYEKYIRPRCVTVGEAADKLHIARTNLSRFINGKSGVSAAMALRIGRATRTDPRQWLFMLAEYNLAKAKEAFQEKSVGEGCLC
jgi:addiction module HigA family antidote